ncbi:MAG: LysR family transcriptional regulator [Phenylobacterium sp.]
MSEVRPQRADWSDIRLFWAVAETGSFGAAARSLRISQSTVTRRIDELERQLGARLFERGPHGVTLTPAGRTALDAAATMERSAEALERQVRNVDDAPEGEVRIAAPDGVAGAFLPPKMTAFLRANPKIGLSFDCGLWPDRPLEGDADLVITFTEPRHPDLVARALAHFHYGLFAARSYLDVYGAPSSLREGVAHAYVDHVAQRHQPERWHPQSEAFLGMVDRRLETNCSAVSLGAIKAGVGLGLLPTCVLSVEPDLVMLEPYLGSVKMWLCWRGEIGRVARIRKTIDWLAECFDPKSQPWFREDFVHPRDFMHLIRPETPQAMDCSDSPRDSTASSVVAQEHMNRTVPSVNR